MGGNIKNIHTEVEVVYSAQVNSVVMSSQTITSLTVVGGATYKASAFIDASYEGDLLSR
jgi:hypothetical protein